MGRGTTRYDGLEDADLARALVAWFAHQRGKRDLWNRTATGRELKAALTALGAFKAKPRGDPAKGRAAMMAARERDAEPHPR